jgi:uncharacterized SAM-binding protein YcdF (DUF218 family)/glycosyltransferase involved in cell wall biosynthesis
MKSTQHNFIIFSSVDWSTHWQLHHQLTTSLNSSGNKVLFIENTGVRSVNIHDIKRINMRFLSWIKGTHGFFDIKDDLTIYSPILLPFPYSKLALFFNKKFFNLSISRWIRASSFNDPIVISFLPTPLIQDAINNINPILKVYYCANNMAESSISASQIRPYEDFFFKSVDIVFTAAYVIQEYAEKISKKVYYFPPGIDFYKFKSALNNNKGIPGDIKSISGPIIGYIGALSKVLDQSMLCTLADQCSNFTIVLIGPEYTNTDMLKAKSNVVFLGAKPHDQLPYYIKEFDVGIVPYVCNDYTKGVYPSKLNEYLAMGISTVSTSLREVVESKEVYGETTIIVNNTDEFVKAVKLLVLEEDSTLLKEKRIKVAKENSWELRFKEILKIIDKNIFLSKKCRKKSSWKSSFSSYFFLGRSFSRLIFVVIFSFLVAFYSPLFWLIGEQLIVKDTLKESDAIVVFSGDGKVSYRNLSYQDRALDAIDLYKQGYSDKIFLSSGREQNIADVEMIRLYLNSRGVPNQFIYTLDEYPNSTYQNVEKVKQSLNKNNIDSILFLTAPYHSLRSTLLWRKNAPNISVTTPDLRNLSSRGIQWDIGLDRMRVIVYEYAAIVYNWLTGRI